MEAMRTTTANEIIVPASPEKGDDLERSHQVVAMTIFIKDVAVAFPVQGGVAVQTNTTSVVKDKEVGTFGDVVKALSVKHVFWMAVKKILRIPNTYASILGLIWSLIAFKYVHFFHTAPHKHGLHFLKILRVSCIVNCTVKYELLIITAAH
jgi:predicted permease